MTADIVRLDKIRPKTVRRRYRGYTITYQYIPESEKWAAHFDVVRSTSARFEKEGKRMQDAERLIKKEIDKLEGD